MTELHFTHNSEKKCPPVTTNSLKQIHIFFKLMQFPKADMSGALRQTDWILVESCCASMCNKIKTAFLNVHCLR